MRGILWLTVLLAGVGCGAPGGDGVDAPAEPAPATAAPAGRLLVLGDVERNDPTKVAAGMQPLAELLAARLADRGITGGVARVAPDPQTMARWMVDGKVDLYFDTAYPASLVREIAGARPLLRRWKRGSPVYHSVVFTRADSGFERVAELAGRLLALDDPASTTGFLVPMAIVIDEGLKPVPVGSPDQRVTAPEVACFFTGDDTNVIEWVLAGRAAAGGIDSLTWAGDIPEETRRRLRILATSEDLPRGFVMVRRDLDPELIVELRRLLLALDESAEGRAALEAMIVSRFDEFPEDPDAALDRILELRRRVAPGPA